MKNRGSIASRAGYARHACSFVLFDTKTRATVIGFKREDDAEAFKRAFIHPNAKAT